METAFVLGAGLGTRLKSLTENVPKPLLPVHQKPLITFAFDHLLQLGVNRFIVNTHHQADSYTRLFPSSQYKTAPITFRHEPVLLETAGGIANITDLVENQTFIVYNGDILTDLNLQPTLDFHNKNSNLVTLVLRSTGPSRHIAFDKNSSKVVDIRNQLNTGAPSAFQFTGIYIVTPEFVSRLTPGKIESVIPAFLDVIRRENRVGGVLADNGSWWDLGDRDGYLEASAALSLDGFPSYGRDPLQQRIHPSARVHENASVCPKSCLGEDTVVESGALIEDSILWPGARATAGARLHRCIARHNALASGDCSNADL